MKYLNEEKLDRLISKVEKSMPYGGILPVRSDTFALHEALMILQFLVKRGFIKFEGNGFCFGSAVKSERCDSQRKATGST